MWFQNRRSKERRMKQLSALGARRHAFFRGPRRMRPLGSRLDESDLLGPGGYGYYGGMREKNLLFIISSPFKHTSFIHSTKAYFSGNTQTNHKPFASPWNNKRFAVSLLSLFSSSLTYLFHYPLTYLPTHPFSLSRSFLLRMRTGGTVQPSEI